MTVTVHDHRGAIMGLNELEFVQGEIFANIWKEDRIARINPETGRITGWIELQGLLGPDIVGDVDVLNGIAYDSENHRLFVTGKLWPKLFEIELIRRE
jgi:glutamine cyclotransferase